MSLKEVRLLAADVAVGETLRTVCPVCQGGTRSEKSLTVTRDDTGVVFNCYRLTCDTAGRFGGRANLIRIRKDVAPRSTHYEGELHEITDEWRQVLRTKIGFDRQHVRKSRVRLGENNRVAYPVLSPLNQRRGWVLRRYGGYGVKALTYMDTADEPHTSWYTTDEWERGDHVYLVEDIPSAVRAARYVDSIALLGTGVSLRAITEIAAHYRSVTWALDADATSVAVNQARKYGIYFDRSRVKILERDFKDMDEQDLKEMLSE